MLVLVLFSFGQVLSAVLLEQGSHMHVTCGLEISCSLRPILGEAEVVRFHRLLLG